MITDELNYRQSQIQDKQLQNNIKLNVINAQIALKQARAAYETAVEARKLQEQVLAGERRKYELGTSTTPQRGAQIQRDTTTRELAEVDSRSQYIKAAQRRSITSWARRWKSRTWISARPSTASSPANPT